MVKNKKWSKVLKHKMLMKFSKAALTVMVIVAFATMTISCISSKEKAERDAATKKALTEAIAKKQWRIAIQSMSTLRYGSSVVSFGYQVELKGDTLVSYLPYMGDVYMPSFSSDGLNFEAPITSYQESRPKPDLTKIELTTKTREDEYVYIFEIFDNGHANLHVRSRNRDSISFTGDYEEPDTKE